MRYDDTNGAGHGDGICTHYKVNGTAMLNYNKAYIACPTYCLLTVGSREAAVERTRTCLQRVSKQ